MRQIKRVKIESERYGKALLKKPVCGGIMRRKKYKQERHKKGVWFIEINTEKLRYQIKRQKNI
jgi:uncharacterized C2H2 Zn-finger protein